MAESSLVLLILGALALAAVEFEHGRNTAQIAELALLEALRAGASDHASPHAMQQAFEHAMRASQPDPPGLTAGTQLRRSWRRREAASGLAAWRLDILNPGPDSLADHAAPGRGKTGNTNASQTGSASAALAFFYQDLRHQEHLSQGWPQGKGPLSGQTVFEANLLTLELRYLHQPLSPPARWLLRLGSIFLPAQTDHDSGQIAQAGLWPIYRRASLPMASEAWAWPQQRLQSTDHLPPPVTAVLPDGSSHAGQHPGGSLPGPLPALPALPAPPTLPVLPGPFPLPEEAAPSPGLPDIPIPAIPDGPELPASSLPEADEALCDTLLCCATSPPAPRPATRG